MAAQSDILENRLIDGLFRGGALNAAGTLNSAAVVTGVWTASTAYTAGQVVVPHANMTGAGGKLLYVASTAGAGTTGTTNTLAIPAVGSTLTDNTVTWTVISVLPAYLTLYFALFTVAPGETGGGTEVTGGSYARVAVTCSLTNFAGTQSAGSTTASSGTGGTTSNNGAITFPTPTANWGSVVAIGVFDLVTGGNLINYGTLTTPKTVNNGDPAPSFAAAAYSFQIDN